MTPEEKRLEIKRRLVKLALAAVPAQRNADGTYGQPPEGMVLNPATGQMTSRELLANDMSMRGDTNPVSSAIIGGAQGSLYGLSDEGAGALAAIPGMMPNNVGATAGQRYDYGREYARAMLDAARKDNPVAAYGGEILGAVATPAGASIRGGTLGARVGAGAAMGGAQGLLYGFGAGEGGLTDRAMSAASGGVLGAVLGGAVPVLGGILRNAGKGMADRAAMRQVIKAAPASDDVRSAANALYQQADQVTNLPRPAFGAIAQKALDDAQRGGMDAMLTPGAARVADRMADVATDPSATVSFREMDILRRQAGIPAGNIANPTEARVAGMMQDAVDEFVESVDPKLAGQVDEARNLWARMRRHEVITEAIEKAQNQASGFENGLRTQFRSILNNKKLTRGMTEAEKDALRAVVRGTPFGNLLRQVGRLGVGLNSQSNAVGMSLGAMLGAGAGSVAGPAGSMVGSVLLPGMATLAKRAANKTTAKAAEAAQALTIMGGKLPAVPNRLDAPAGLLENLLMRANPVTANELRTRIGL